MDKLKVLVFDIETAPMLVHVFDRKEQYISVEQIERDWYVLAWAAKWFGDPVSKVIHRNLANTKERGDDKAILEDLWKLLDEADVVITQNGKRFDSPKLNARFILHGMPPPRPYKHYDTYQLASRVGRFTSASLEYLTDKLCVKYKKLSHKRFPGLSLWKQCLKGNKTAWQEMKRYNIHDVLSTEELTTKLRAWAPTGFPDIFPVHDPSNECGACGVAGQMKPRGFTVAKIKRYPRFRCDACGKWQQGFKALKEAA